MKNITDAQICEALIHVLTTDFEKDTTIDGITVGHIIRWLKNRATRESVDEIVKRCKNSWYNEGKIAGQAEGLTVDEKYQQGWHDALEKQPKAFSDINIPSRELIFSIWDLGNEWKMLTNGRNSTEHGTQLEYIQKHWKDSEYYLTRKQDDVQYLQETKFMTGDCVVNNATHNLCHIVKVEHGQYICDDCSFPINKENEYHLWSIADAKDGDILCTYECDEPKIVFILKGIPKKHYPLSYYCYYNIIYPYFQTDSEKGCLAPNDKDIKPATKEQRDLLFKKMKDAGYMWDDEKKKLMIKSETPRFKVGDWICCNHYSIHITSIKDGLYYFNNENSCGNIEFIDDNYHLWTIKDAKDGDVLAEDSCIFIIRKLGDKSTIAKTYCALFNDGDFYDDTMLCFDVDSTKPATKEQCEQLFKKMEEECYTWDAKKKELKKCIKPKFNVGDWITNDDRNLFQITKIDNGWYYADDEDKVCFDVVHDYYHLWSIQDAKPGDVLSDGNMILIFKQFETPAYKQYIIAYIGLDLLGHIQVTDGTWNLGIDNAKPATKEQRDMLFQKMKEAGYTWDDEKKELTHSQETNKSDKVRWSEKDQEFFSLLEGYLELDYDLSLNDKANTMDWLKSIKERLK